MKPDALFLEAYTFTKLAEGGLSLDRNDPGNWTGGKVGVGELKGTKYGVSAKSYPHLDIRNLTPQQAMEIFYLDFWLKPRFNQIPVPQMAKRLFDLGVNCGPGTAAKMLQRAVNTVCAGYVAPQRMAPWRQTLARLFGGGSIRVDGKVGPITIGTITHCPFKGALYMALSGEAYKHYETLDAAYIPGWLERLYKPI
jgi:lysozyme family protein